MVTQFLSPERGGRLFAARLIVGIVYGVLLFVSAELRADRPQFGLSEFTWRRAVESYRTAVAFAPLPLLFGLGALPALRLAAWVAGAAAALAYVGWMAPAPVWTGAAPVVTVWLFSLIVVFIVHELIAAANADGRRVAQYETYFDLAWRHGFQTVLALIFVGAFWIVISLGAMLFRLIGLEFFADIVFSEEFAWIASATAFALGVHWTDEGSGLTRGARQIGLALLAWLSVLMTLNLTAFLIALPFTGLEPLWDTKRATVLLLNAAATMILLVNAAFQAGEPPRAALIRWVVRFSPAPMLGVVALAFLGLWLRINQYGLTPARVLAGAELVIVAYYAVGYAAAALRRGPWLALIKPINIAGAALVAAMLLALMTPLADPARLSVANQVARLDSGRVEPDDFDFGFLANERSRHWGPKALERLAARSGSERDERIAHLAQNPGDQSSARRVQQSVNARRDSLLFLGAGDLPEAVLTPLPIADPIADCVRARTAALEAEAVAAERRRREQRLSRKRDDDEATFDGRCRARRLDLDRDGDDDLLLWRLDQYEYAVKPKTRFNVRNMNVVALVDDDGAWRAAGAVNWRLDAFNRTGLRQTFAGVVWDDRAPAPSLSLEAADAAFGAATTVDPFFNDVEIEGGRARLTPYPTPLSPQEMRAALTPVRGAEPPEALLTFRPAENRLNECAASDGRLADFCFGLSLELARGDAGADYLLAIFPVASTGASLVRFQTFSESDGAWRATAEGRVALPFAVASTAAKRDADVYKRLAADHASEIDRMANAARSARPLLDDVEIAGERFIFGYIEPPFEE